MEYMMRPNLLHAISFNFVFPYYSI